MCLSCIDIKTNIEQMNIEQILVIEQVLMTKMKNLLSIYINNFDSYYM